METERRMVGKRARARQGMVRECNWEYCSGRKVVVAVVVQ